MYAEVLWRLAGGSQDQVTGWTTADTRAMDKTVQRRLNDLMAEKERAAKAVRNATRVRAASGQCSDPEKQARDFLAAKASLAQLRASVAWSGVAPPNAFLSPAAFKLALKAASAAGTPQPAAATPPRRSRSRAWLRTPTRALRQMRRVDAAPDAAAHAERSQLDARFARQQLFEAVGLQGAAERTHTGEAG